VTVEAPWALILFGGARSIAAADAQANRDGCRTALELGEAVLLRGGTALDAVEAAVVALETDATFNAGYGAVLNADGIVQLDAAIMTGEDLAVGAVGALEGVRHPVRVARRLLAETPSLLVGQGAAAFALGDGAPAPEPEAKPARRLVTAPSGDTVGCIALDVAGRMAVALSTGGLEGKAPGRVGDTPLPGCGFYVDDLIGGVAVSGDGDAIARTMLAARVMAGLETRPPQAAAEQALAHLGRVGGEGGVIVLDRLGRFGCAHTSEHFAVALSSSRFPSQTALKQDELKAFTHG
jgi:beta-aspartyl-peptidase (threonine type)